MLVFDRKHEEFDQTLSKAHPLANPTLMACPECDLLHRATAPPRGGMTLCSRCGAVLERGRQGSLEVALALYLTALLLFFLANAFPLLALNLHGTIQEASIPRCARILVSMGWPWLSAVLITTVILAPLAHILGMILVIVQIRLGLQDAWTARIFRIVGEFHGWGMAEVFVLGLLISYVKLAQWAVVVPGPSLFALGAFMIVVAAAVSSLDPQALWNQIQPLPPSPFIPRGVLTARGASLVACPTCGLLSPLAGTTACPRCDATLHSRKPNGRQRTWALLITTAVLYIPANQLPVMRVVSVGHAQADTIFSGILHLARSGSWALALVILIASILVPLFKVAILTVLLLSERSRSRWRPDHRARLYRLMEAVGRWSMVDIFVVILMVAIVEVGGLATIAPGPGAVAFALMVIAAMLAVRSFDPRLVWDALEPDHG